MSADTPIRTSGAMGRRTFGRLVAVSAGALLGSGPEHWVNAAASSAQIATGSPVTLSGLGLQMRGLAVAMKGFHRAGASVYSLRCLLLGKRVAQGGFGFNIVSLIKREREHDPVLSGISPESPLTPLLQKIIDARLQNLFSSLGQFSQAHSAFHRSSHKPEYWEVLALRCVHRDAGERAELKDMLALVEGEGLERRFGGDFTAAKAALKDNDASPWTAKLGRKLQRVLGKTSPKVMALHEHVAAANREIHAVYDRAGVNYDDFERVLAGTLPANGSGLPSDSAQKLFDDWADRMESDLCDLPKGASPQAQETARHMRQRCKVLREEFRPPAVERSSTVRDGFECQSVRANEPFTAEGRALSWRSPVPRLLFDIGPSRAKGPSRRG